MNKKTKLIIIITIVLITAASLYVWKKHYVPNAVVTNGAINMLADHPKEKVVAEDVQYFEAGQGFYARPKAEGNYPGIVMVHEWWGLNQNIKDMAVTLAKDGYQVLAVDLYRGQVATTPEEAMQYKDEVPTLETTRNLQAAVGFLKSKGATKIASLGWCYGGGKSLELALSGIPLDATVLYYGTLVTDKAQLAKIKWPVLGIFGDADQTIKVAQVKQFETALNALKINNQIYVYKGVGHAFANPSGQSYAPEETKDAWEKTKAFLASSLKV